MKKQVDITTGIPLHKNKSFAKKVDSSWTKLPNNKKKSNKERFLMWIIIGSIIVVMVYCAFFVGLKQTNFFGAETKNIQTIW